MTLMVETTIVIITMLNIMMIMMTWGRLSYSRILSIATLSLSRLHIILTVQLKDKVKENMPKTMTRHYLVESPIIMM